MQVLNFVNRLTGFVVMVVEKGVVEAISIIQFWFFLFVQIFLLILRMNFMFWNLFCLSRVGYRLLSIGGC